MSNKWRMWVGIVAVFICGLIIGGVGGHLWARNQAMRHISRISHDQGSFMAEMTLQRLSEELNLTRDQAVTIKPLLINAYRLGHERIKETRLKMDDIFKKTMEAIKQHLTQEQIKQVDPKQGFRMLLPPPPPGGPPDGPSEGPLEPKP